MEIRIRVELPPVIRLDISEDLIALAGAFVERLGGAIAVAPKPARDAGAEADAAPAGPLAAKEPAASGADEASSGRKWSVPESRGWATAARRAVLRRDWPLGIPVEVIRDRLAALAGPPLPGNAVIGRMAFNLGVRRPGGPGSRSNPPEPAATAAPQPAASAATDAIAGDLGLRRLPGRAPEGVVVAEPGGAAGPALPRDCRAIGWAAHNMGLHRRPRPALPAAAQGGVALVTRDGAPSVAAAEDARNAAYMAGPVPVDFAEVEAWARANRIAGAPWELLRAVNAARDACALPRFIVPLQQLPGRSVGGR